MFLKLSKPVADIGVFGGSGFYEFIEDAKEVKVDTPFGVPSDVVTIGEIKGKKVAFLPRHGRSHSLPPHKIPYRANLWVMKELGVTRIIGPCAAGSLQANVKPGEFVFCDQFVDRTWGRSDTFYDGPVTTHISAAEPYCPHMRKIAISCAKKLGIPYHPAGTVVVIQGPRFSTKAESAWFTSMGWEVINMTQYPECILARELGICYLNISLITDYDVGLVTKGDVKPVSHEEVLKVFKENNQKLKLILWEIISELSQQRLCDCKDALKNAR